MSKEDKKKSEMDTDEGTNETLGDVQDGVMQSGTQEDVTLDDLKKQLATLQDKYDQQSAQLKSTNAESAERRVRLKELEEAEEARKLEQMGDLEKAQALATKWETAHNEAVAGWETKYSALESKLQNLVIAGAVERAANELGFAHPQDAVALIDLSSLTIDESGVVSGYKESLEELAKSKRLVMREQETQLGTAQQQENAKTGSRKRVDRQAYQQQKSKKFNL